MWPDGGACAHTSVRGVEHPADRGRGRALSSTAVTVERRMPWSADATGLLLGVALDALLGDPRRGHPVAAFGRAATALERRIHADSKARGAIFTGVCVTGAAGLGLAAGRLTRS